MDTRIQRESSATLDEQVAVSRTRFEVAASEESKALASLDAATADLDAEQDPDARRAKRAARDRAAQDHADARYYLNDARAALERDEARLAEQRRWARVTERRQVVDLARFHEAVDPLVRAVAEAERRLSDARAALAPVVEEERDASAELRSLGETISDLAAHHYDSSAALLLAARDATDPAEAAALLSRATPIFHSGGGVRFHGSPEEQLAAVREEVAIRRASRTTHAADQAVLDARFRRAVAYGGSPVESVEGAEVNRRRVQRIPPPDGCAFPDPESRPTPAWSVGSTLAQTLVRRARDMGLPV